MILETQSVVIRIRDVGIALRASGELGVTLNRLRLQKFIYLLDQVGQLVRLIPPKVGHYSFRNGPFDPRIQNAVDSLAFRGLVEIKSLFKAKTGAIYSEYGLSAPGRSWTQALYDSPAFQDRCRAAQLIAAHMNRLGWDRIKQLVYAEPAYVAARPKGYGKQLRELESTRASSAALFRAIARALSNGFKNEPTVELIVDLYFEYLDEFSTAESKYQIDERSTS